MNSSYHYQVVIIGAGPNGAVLGNLLGQLGIQTLIVDKSPTPSSIPRAAHLDDEGLRILQSIGLDEIIKEYSLELAVRFNRSYDGDTMATIEPGGTEYGHPRSVFWYQPQVEAILRDGLARYSGHVKVCDHHRLVGFQYVEEENMTTAMILDCTSNVEMVIKCRYLIGADGGHSFVRNSLGLAFPGSTCGQRWLVVDTHLDDQHPKLPSFFQFVLDPARPRLSLPIAGSNYRWEFVMKDHETKEELLDPASSDHLIKANGGDLQHMAITRKGVYSFHNRIASKFSDGHSTFLVGDSAHCLPPFLGLGISCGMRDSINLAWKLDLAIRGVHDEHALFETYEQERRPDIMAIANNAQNVGHIVMSTNRVLAWLRDLLFFIVSLLPVLASKFFTSGMKPRSILTQGVIDPTHPHLSGHLIIQPLVNHVGSMDNKRLDYFLGTGFSILLLNGQDQSILDIITSHTNILVHLRTNYVNVERLSLATMSQQPSTHLISLPQCSHISNHEDKLNQFFGNKTRVVIIRPDKYIYGTYSSASAFEHGLESLAHVGLTVGKKNDRGPYPVMLINKLETVQTHVIPEDGLRWSLPKRNVSYHLVGGRQTMFLVDLAIVTEMESPVLEAWNGGVKLGEAPLNPPSTLRTEDNGTMYTTTAWNALFKPEWMAPGLSVMVNADNYEPSAFRSIKVGMASHMDLRTLPFYLFGCNDTTCGALNVTGQPNSYDVSELLQRWPVATLDPSNHPGKRIDWPYLILHPNGTLPAVKIINKNQERDGFGTMGVVLGIIGAMRGANGEGSTNNQYYTPLLMLNSVGKLGFLGGGLGTVGGSTGVGDSSYSGVFIHEQGHAFGLPHSGDAYLDGNFPYVQGSCNGSTWGYDFDHAEFLSIYIPVTSSNFKNCNLTRIVDADKRCIKQDPMQSGGGDKAKGYKYSMFPDFDMGVMQMYFEGTTTLDSKGNHTYKGGKIFYDATFPTGYKRWDTLDSKWVMFTPTNSSNTFDSGLPYLRDVPVYNVIYTHSSAGTPDVSQIYPPLKFIGNLRRQIDPTNLEQLKLMNKTLGGPVPSYCNSDGCDYTLRVTYKDNSKVHILLQDGIRFGNNATSLPNPDSSNPLHSESFHRVSINVPGSKALKTIDLLDTPMGFKGIAASPKVLATRSF
eukprot:gene12808-15030_t